MDSTKLLVIAVVAAALGLFVLSLFTPDRATENAETRLARRPGRAGAHHDERQTSTGDAHRGGQSHLPNGKAGGGADRPSRIGRANKRDGATTGADEPLQGGRRAVRAGASGQGAPIRHRDGVSASG